MPELGQTLLLALLPAYGDFCGGLLAEPARTPNSAPIGNDSDTLRSIKGGVEALASRPWPGTLEHEVFLVALAGLVLFYGLERLAAASRKAERARAGEDCTGMSVFALHLGTFAVYNFLIGYLLLHGERDNLAFYTVAMGLHFIVNDHGLREHHKRRYEPLGRWLLAAAVLAGWRAGAMTPPVSRLAVVALTALLAGRALTPPLPGGEGARHCTRHACSACAPAQNFKQSSRSCLSGFLD